VNAHESKCFSTETLLDVLMVLFNECCNSSLRKEKTVTEFIELGKSDRSDGGKKVGVSAPTIQAYWHSGQLSAVFLAWPAENWELLWQDFL
jgi:hypothetical protein